MITALQRPTNAPIIEGYVVPLDDGPDAFPGAVVISERGTPSKSVDLTVSVLGGFLLVLAAIAFALRNRSTAQ